MPTRRDTNRQLAALVAAGVALPVPDLVRKALWAPGEVIGADLITAREGIMSAFVTAFRQGGSSDLLPTVAGFADNLGPLLRRAPTWELGLRMATLMVDAHGMAGVLASGWDPRATRAHLAVASRVAAASGVPVLKARAWALEAKLVHSVLENGPHGSARTAVEQLRRAKALARHADGFTRAWVLASYVEEAADLGDYGLCMANMQAAYRAFDTAIGHDGGFFSPQGCFGGALYLGRPAGRLDSLAGRLDEAERSVGAEVAGTAAAGRHGRTINALCTLATVRIENDEPEAACDALGDALATGRPGRLVDRIRAVRLRIDPALNTLDAVRHLDEQLRLAA